MMCEADPYAHAVLENRFPGIEIAPDVKAMSSLPACDLLTAGWPCQDLSLAGGTKGLEGSRSGLVSEIFRLIEASAQRPRYVLLENVAFALDLQKGIAVTYATDRLEALGYRWAYRILDTRAFGLPQRRRRLFILAALDRDPAAILLDGIDGPPLAVPLDPGMVGFYWTEGTRGLGWSPEAVPPLKGGSGLGIPSPPAIWDRRSGRFLVPSIEDAERLQGFPSGWTAPAIEMPRGERRRWVLVGNAVSVPVAEWIGGRLGNPDLLERTTWPREKIERTGIARAATGGPGLPIERLAVSREGPSIGASLNLTDFGLRSPTMLSARAVGGFSRRYAVAPLRKNEEFLEALLAWPRELATA
jgi:DNA (cytosine-5)-methyltransferase 1